jgi:hypothetical protein
MHVNTPTGQPIPIARQEVRAGRRVQSRLPPTRNIPAVAIIDTTTTACVASGHKSMSRSFC